MRTSPLDVLQQVEHSDPTCSKPSSSPTPHTPSVCLESDAEISDEEKIASII